MKTKEIKTLTAKRGGKQISMQVEVTGYEGNATRWIRKADGKPFFGTTGYYQTEPGAFNSDTTKIFSHRCKRRVLVTDVVLS